MKLPTLSSPLKLFAPALAGPVPGMAGATGGHMMFASSGGGRGGDYDQDDFGYEDDFGDEPPMEPDDEEARRRPRSTRTVRASAGATGGQPRTAQHQPEERYWTDYLRIALPVVGLLLMIGLLWFWATQLIGDSPETTDPATEDIGLVSQGTPEPTEEIADLQGDTTQPGSSTIGIGAGASTPEAQQQQPQQPQAQTGEDDPAADEAQEPEQPAQEEPAAGGEFSSGDPVIVTEDGVNVRPEAGTAGEPITMLSAGDELIIASGPVEGDTYTWWEVILPGGDSGWVVEDFIEPAE